MAEDFIAKLPDDIEKNVEGFLAGKNELSRAAKTYLGRFAGGNAWMLEVGELAKLALQSWSGGWTPERTTAALEGSRWYRTHTDQQRQWAGLSKVDQQRAIENQAIAMSNYWYQISGERRDPSSFMTEARAVASGTIPDARWRFDQDTRALEIPESPIFRERRGEEEAQRQRGVDVENLAGQLEGKARGEYLTPIDRDAAAKWATDIASNVSSEQDFIDFIRERSASKFPQYSEKILAGGVPAQLFGDYLQMAREELESGALTFDDTLVMSGITGGMPLADYQSYLRQQPRFRATRRAQNMGSDLTVQLLETFGKVVA